MRVHGYSLLIGETCRELRMLIQKRLIRSGIHVNATSLDMNSEARILGQTERSQLKEHFRRHMKFLAELANMLNSQSAFLAQHLGHNAGSYEYIEQVFLLESVGVD